MSNFLKLSALALLILGVMLFPACHAEHDDDGEHGHVHGPGEECEEEGAHENDADEEAEGGGHDHAHGPHDGHMVVFGDHLGHVELLRDKEAGTLTVYVLGADAKTELPLAIAPKLNLITEGGNQQLELQPVGEGPGCEFTITDDCLKAEAIKGRIALELDGKSYSANL